MAENQNDWSTAKRDFLKAYSLDPSNAFSLNNRGYVAEMDGDLESAQFFYEKALRAGGADVRVGLATENSAEGKPLFQVATESDQKVDGALDIYSRERRQQSAPVELTPRDNGTPEVHIVSDCAGNTNCLHKAINAFHDDSTSRRVSFLQIAYSSFAHVIAAAAVWRSASSREGQS